MNRLCIAIREQPLLPPLSTNTALLVAREITRRMGLLEAIDPERAHLESASEFLRFLSIPGPDAGTQAALGVVGPAEYLLLGLPG
jgi:hypothetical protein